MRAACLQDKSAHYSICTLDARAPGRGEVMVRVKAASLNHIEQWIRRGAFPGLPVPIVPGSDGAGQVVNVGAGVDTGLIGMDVILNPALNWESGDVPGPDFGILGIGNRGTFAEYVTLPARNVRPKPSHLTWEQAAALPMAGLTAYRALLLRARLRPEDTLLVTGIGGGVASTALQFALSLGCTVHVTSSSAKKLEQARALGAAGGVDYSEPGWAKHLQELTGGFDVIFDAAGGKGISELTSLARPGGRVVSIGMTSGASATLDVQALFAKQLTIVGSMMGSAEDFDRMLAFVSQHRITPVVDRAGELAEIDALSAHQEAQHQFGKLVAYVN